jgi:predicted nucleotidyltransferase
VLVSTLESVIELRSLGERSVAALGHRPEVRGATLIGSVSRDNADACSDVDIVVLVEGTATRAAVRAWLPPALRDDTRLSLLPHTPAKWLGEAARGSLFVHHVRTEGSVLTDPDGTFARSFAIAAEAGMDIAGELRMRSARLRLFRDLRRLNGQHLFALSQLYSIGKGVAIARCAEFGELTFVKQEAFTRLAKHRPEWSARLQRIAELRPFYDLTHEREVASLPFEPVDAEEQLATVIDDIETLAGA